MKRIEIESTVKHPRTPYITLRWLRIYSSVRYIWRWKPAGAHTHTHTHTHTNRITPHLGAGVAVYGAEVQSSCVYTLHQGLASRGTDTCGKETEID